MVHLLAMRTVSRKVNGIFSSNCQFCRITNLISGNPFRFVSVHSPSTTKDPKSSRLVRSHAVKQGLKAKRKFQKESNGNFRVGFPTRDIQTSPSSDSASLYSSASTHDPFDMLVVDSWRLKSLLGYCKYLYEAYTLFLGTYTKGHKHS